MLLPEVRDDALNQLDETDSAHDLHWIPAQLPPHVKVVASCITDSSKPERVLEVFSWRKHRGLSIEPLSDPERGEIIRQVPSLSAKALDEGQIGMLLDNPSTANPMFLLVALEELRGFGSYEQLNDRIAAMPREELAAEVLERARFSFEAMRRAGDPVTALFTQVIERLEMEFDNKPLGVRSEFNKDLVATVLMLLVCSRRGLSERELQGLVVGLKGADNLFSVLRQLRPYLLRRGSLIGFYHTNLLKAVRTYYLDTDEKLKSGHHRLASYFDSFPLLSLEPLP